MILLSIGCIIAIVSFHLASGSMDDSAELWGTIPRPLLVEDAGLRVNVFHLILLWALRLVCSSAWCMSLSLNNSAGVFGWSQDGVIFYLLLKLTVQGESQPRVPLTRFPPLECIGNCCPPFQCEYFCESNFKDTADHKPRIKWSDGIC